LKQHKHIHLYSDEKHNNISYKTKTAKLKVEEENIKMALNNGFSHCEVVFRWANFATSIAIK
jgi:hypothetical protein